MINTHGANRFTGKIESSQDDSTPQNVTTESQTQQVVLISDLILRPDIRKRVQKTERRWPELWAARVCRVSSQLIVVEGFALIDAAIAAGRIGIKAIITDSSLDGIGELIALMRKAKRARAQKEKRNRDRVPRRQVINELRTKIRDAMLSQPDATCDQIAAMFGCSFNSVWTVRQQLLIEMPTVFAQSALKKRRSETRLMSVRQMIVDALIATPGMSNNQLSIATGQHRRTVGRIVQELIVTQPELFTASQQSDSQCNRPIEIDAWDAASDSWKLHIGVGNRTTADKIFAALVAVDHNRRVRVRRTEVLMQNDGDIS